MKFKICFYNYIYISKMNNNEAKPQTHQAKARLKAARSIFELADTNKDGFITFDEVLLNIL